MVTFSLSITTFKTESYLTNSVINEFKTFIENNTQFQMSITSSTYPSLTSDNFYEAYGIGNGYWVGPNSLSAANKQKIPGNVQTNMILYDWIGLTPAIVGGTYGGDAGINGIPYIAIPIGLPSTYPYNGLASWGPWTYAITQTLVHEWIHALDWILMTLGYPDFPSAEDCPAHGYTFEGDPGWSNCYKHFFSTITSNMYNDVQGWNMCQSLQTSLYIQ